MILYRADQVIRHHVISLQQLIFHQYSSRAYSNLFYRIQYRLQVKSNQIFSTYTSTDLSFTHADLQLMKGLLVSAILT